MTEFEDNTNSNFQIKKKNFLVDDYNQKKQKKEGIVITE